MSNSESIRIAHLTKARERAREDAELLRKKVEQESANMSKDIGSKFTANYDAVEEALKASTVGLVTLEEMREKQMGVILDKEAKLAQSVVVGDELVRAKKKTGKDEKSGHSATSTAPKRGAISFAFDDEEEEDGEPVVPVKKRIGMDPTVDTSFLPDRERDEEIARKKEVLAKEWHAQQEKEKAEEINVAYAYWDGSSHRRDMRVKKGMTIAQFLSKAIEVLKREFTELKLANPEQVMFVKEDLIIPSFYTFQDFIVTKAMGKTGPLYIFDAVGEIRLRSDAALSSTESHPAKVVLRSWYEKNKHIYPASRWEPFVPNKEYKNSIDDLEGI